MKDAKAALKRAETLSAPSTTKKICTKESQGHNQVYGIRDHSPGIGIIDPGSRVTSPGIRISHFLCVSLRDQGLCFSDTSLLMRN